MREVVWYPLMAIAALELALYTKIQWRTTTMLAVGHAAILWGVLRLGGGLCVERGLDGDYFRWGEEAMGEGAN